jgi:hypothetical protein
MHGGGIFKLFKKNSVSKRNKLKTPVHNTILSDIKPIEHMSAKELDELIHFIKENDYYRIKSTRFYNKDKKSPAYKNTMNHVKWLDDVFKGSNTNTAEGKLRRLIKYIEGHQLNIAGNLSNNSGGYFSGSALKHKIESIKSRLNSLNRSKTHKNMLHKMGVATRKLSINVPRKNSNASTITFGSVSSYNGRSSNASNISKYSYNNTNNWT